jgi:hypothetical protein
MFNFRAEGLGHPQNRHLADSLFKISRKNEKAKDPWMKVCQ